MPAPAHHVAELNDISASGQLENVDGIPGARRRNDRNGLAHLTNRESDVRIDHVVVSRGHEGGPGRPAPTDTSRGGHSRRARLEIPNRASGAPLRDRKPEGYTDIRNE